ncbi:MAG: HD domain-containing protein [Anaerolineaceae bacterium]|jgi:5'-deoxynucleotidase YfbR-like HD superfamily hydrolase|nr:MAG: HD domain-containing protein [Anaerolineaceae bacterium]
MKTMNIDKPLLKSLLIMADIIEARDPYTGGHVWRVSQFAKLLATKIGLPEEEIIKISVAAYLHDLGKVGIPDDILKKEAALTEAEYAIIKTHPSIGSRLLGGHPLAEMVSSAANDHHERMDGKGYPRGLSGGQISLTARIISVADAFDAMTSVRPYRKGMSVEHALCRLEEGAGTQFDSALVGHICELGRAGDLTHIVGHTADGIPAVTCPHCGPVIAIPRNTKDGDVIYCRACHSQLELLRVGNTFEAEMTGMTDDPRNLEPRANEDAVEDILSQIG